MRKSLLITIAILVCALLAPTSGFAEDNAYGYTLSEEQGYVIDLLDTPSDDGEVLFSYYPGVRIELLKDSEGDWLHVRVCNIDGYMKANQVDFAHEQEVPSVLPVMLVKTKTDAGSLNLRELPTFDKGIIGYYYHNKEIHVMGIGGEWYHVIADGRMGFMKPEFLADTGNVAEYVIGPFQSSIEAAANN